MPAARATLLRLRLARSRAALSRTPRTTWPTPPQATSAGARRLGIVAVNFNTRQLIAQLVFSLYRLLGRDQFETIVIVDNGSTDGSVELLQALADAGLIHLLRNASQRYHGPALTQGVSWLAERQETLEPARRLDYVWVIDSDVVVLRSDTVRVALDALESSGAAALGQKILDPALNRVLRHSPAMLHPSSMILDPARIWQPSIPPFVEDGAPALALQAAADAQGLHVVAFPFVEDGYLVHLGRGTLREVADSQDRLNRYYRWSRGHRDYHYSDQPHGAELYSRFGELFFATVGDLTPARLVDVCREPAVLALE